MMTGQPLEQGIQNKWYNVKYGTQGARVSVSPCCQSIASESPKGRFQMAFAVITMQPYSVIGYPLLSRASLNVYACAHADRGVLCLY